MIKVLVVDDHPAVSAGLEVVLRSEPGLVPVGSCGSLEEGRRVALRERPSVVIVDYELGDGNGLELCMELAFENVGTLLYSAYSERALTPAALLAGAGGLLHKSASADELCDGVRCVARSLPLFPPVGRDVLEVCAARIDPSDLPILGMVVEGTPADEIAEVLKLTADEYRTRIGQMVERLRPSTRAFRRLPGAA